MQNRWIAVGLVVLAGCSGGASGGAARQRPTTADPAVVTLPGPPGAPPLAAAESEPKTLPGVDTSALADREQKVWWKLVNALYAPCADQAVSIAQCVEEARQCSACTPAAKFLAARVHQGAGVDDARAAYGVRFGPDIKKVAIADSPSRGPEGAPVTIMVWSDFQCPHCRAAMPILDGLFDKYNPRIRLVHKFYPLQKHTTAEPSARAAIAAQNQGHYWEMERLLFGHQSAQTDADLEKYASSLKLDMNRWRADLHAAHTDEVLDRDHADADRCGLGGTPFILINGREFNLDYFRLEGDLEAWVALEVEMTANQPRQPPPAQAAAR